ncbi:MAG: cysteine--tRNA ligase [Planctomycetota bacterium]|nr:MAG: cysteine--tRNA ligase [Planctomycetota bacterium]
MELRFYNTLSRRIEPFEPLEPGRVRMYHCGPTVYQRPHIGNYRAFLFADLLRRVFEARGYEVLQVMNITDVGHLVADADDGEDKLQAQAEKERIDPWELVERVSAEFFADLEALGVRPAHHYPRATQHIPEMVELVRRLLATGHAYRVGDNVYFDVHSFPGYGRLSGNRVEDLEAGARLEPNPEKRHPADFALWKSDPHHLMKWETEFGPHGFPGWHVECSAMAMKYLGESFDIHTGGEDNVFPHHECEIAQSEGATGQPFVRLWMHTKFLQVDGGKMSKSLGNVWNLDDLAERGFSPLDYRFFVLRAHYRGSLNFTWDALAGAREARRALNDLRGRLAAAAAGAAPGRAPVVERARTDFAAALADDLNTSAAVAALFELRNAFLRDGLEPAGAAAALDFLVEEADAQLGFLDPTAAVGPSDEEVEALLAERAEARAARDFARADAIRDRLQRAGIVLEDSPDGVRWHRS